MCVEIPSAPELVPTGVRACNQTVLVTVQTNRPILLGGARGGIMAGRSEAGVVAAESSVSDGGELSITTTGIAAAKGWDAPR